MFWCGMSLSNMDGNVKLFVRFMGQNLKAKVACCCLCE